MKQNIEKKSGTAKHGSAPDCLSWFPSSIAASDQTAETRAGTSAFGSLRPPWVVVRPDREPPTAASRKSNERHKPQVRK